MKLTDLTRYVSLIVASGLLLSGVVEASDPGLSAVLLALGILTFGCWLTLEIHALLSRKDDTDGQA